MKPFQGLAGGSIPPWRKTFLCQTAVIITKLMNLISLNERYACEHIVSFDACKCLFSMIVAGGPSRDKR